jgi:hypothetical protein
MAGLFRSIFTNSHNGSTITGAIIAKTITSGVTEGKIRTDDSSRHFLTPYLSNTNP